MRQRAAFVGVLSGAVALAVGELVAGVRGSRRSPVIAVGDEVIERVPRAVKDWAISWFGTGDKVALLVGIYVVLALFAALTGVVAVRRLWLGASGIALFGVVGALSGAPWDSFVGAAFGIGALWWLVTRGGEVVDDESRRRFLVGAAGAVGLAAATAAMGRYLQGRVSAAASRAAVVLPRVRSSALPAGVEVGVDGVAPFVTAANGFYRIDTALLVPQVAAESWTLRVHGLVSRELTFSYDELLARDFVEEDITIACVSNEVGGDLIGNARWLGTSLRSVLAEAGVRADADQIVGRSVDGFTVGFPVSALDDDERDRPALIAVGMNGEPLPIKHGFPARLIVAGLYGYVSATKWLSEIELTRFDAFDQYWVQRGWEPLAPIKTESRIDTPRPFAKVQAGVSLPIGGVAWAPTRGVAAVEVRIDDGPWLPADLGEVPNDLTWRQWVVRTTLSPGRHDIRVRATDGDGKTQTDEQVPPFPDGATGWHTVRVTAE